MYWIFLELSKKRYIVKSYPSSVSGAHFSDILKPERSSCSKAQNEPEDKTVSPAQTNGGSGRTINYGCIAVSVGGIQTVPSEMDGRTALCA